MYGRELSTSANLGQDVSSPEHATCPGIGNELRNRHLAIQWPHALSVGGTELVHLGHVVPGHPELNVYVKLEGENVTSTMKARPAQAHVEEALRRGYKEITVGSCGNYAEAIAWFASQRGIRCTVFVPAENHDEAVIRHIELGCVNEDPALSAKVSLVHGNRGYQGAVDASNAYAARNRDVYNANVGAENDGIENFDIDCEAYAPISQEITDALNKHSHAGELIEPEAVVSAMGNGTLVRALRHGFEKIGVSTRLIGCTSSNPIYSAWRAGDRDCRPLEKAGRITSVNECVAGETALDGRYAIKAIKDSGGRVYQFDSPEIETAKNQLEDRLKHAGHPRKLLPISGIAWAALEKYGDEIASLGERERRHGKKRGPIVLIATGERD